MISQGNYVFHFMCNIQIMCPGAYSQENEMARARELGNNIVHIYESEYECESAEVEYCIQFWAARKNH